jgi:mRNA-degrading endonuclease RelE of RelBE toxin-antitoxin system
MLTWSSAPIIAARARLSFIVGRKSESECLKGEKNSMFTIEYAKGVAEDLKNIRAYERVQILDGIDKQLMHEPSVQTRNRKILVGLIPPWEYIEPVWELRIGEYRVFYDVDEESSAVIVRAIRHKPANKKTEEIL